MFLGRKAMELMNVLHCPVCDTELIQIQKCFVCENRHSFDIAKSGYVNLLLSKDMNSKLPGDNKQMVQARHQFLSGGYYKILSDSISEAVIKNLICNNPVILDAGCGEGYYTDILYNNLFIKGKQPQIIGVDISKIAVDFAAKRNKNITFLAASVFHLPIGNNSCDVVLSVFSPICEEEINRVLKPNGILIIVFPASHHLWELKNIAYNKAYENQENSYNLVGFRLKEKKIISDEIKLQSKADINSLFQMTPYFYTTPKDGVQRLSQLESLNTQIEFELETYIKTIN